MCALQEEQKMQRNVFFVSDLLSRSRSHNLTKCQHRKKSITTIPN